MNLFCCRAAPGADQSDTMSRMETIQKQDLKKKTRTRKMNFVARNQLEGTLCSIENLFQKQRKQQRIETRRIEDEIRKLEHDNSNLTQLSLPPVSQDKPRFTPPKTPDRVRRSDTNENLATTSGCVHCKFNNNKHCRYFPCYLPVSYHSMGNKAKEKSFTILDRYDEFLSRCAKVRPASNVRAREAEEQRKDEELKKPSRVSVKDKERGLKNLIQQMRARNDEKYKPREWVTNYGNPLPRRMLLKPVIPVSESI